MATTKKKHEKRSQVIEASDIEAATWALDVSTRGAGSPTEDTWVLYAFWQRGSRTTAVAKASGSTGRFTVHHAGHRLADAEELEGARRLVLEHHTRLARAAAA